MSDDRAWTANRLRLRHPRDPRRPAARSDHRRGDAADLRHLDLRAVEPRRAQGLRLRAQPQPDARIAFERCVADLESGARGFAFASGLAAIAHRAGAARRRRTTSSPCDDLYGGTFRLFERVRKRSAGPAASASSTSPTSRPSRRRSGRRRRMIWVETPTNPLLQAGRPRGAWPQLAQDARPDRGRRQHLRQPLLPAAAGARLRHRRALDDQVPERPLRRGRRRCWSSATSASWRDQLAFLQNAVGAIAGPVRLLPGAARPEDAGAAHGAALRQRASPSPRGSRAIRRSRR